MTRPLPAVAKRHLLEAHKRIKAVRPGAYDIKFSIMGAVSNTGSSHWYNWFEFRDKNKTNHKFAVELAYIKLGGRYPITPAPYQIKQLLLGDINS